MSFTFINDKENEEVNFNSREVEFVQILNVFSLQFIATRIFLRWFQLHFDQMA